MIKVNDLRNIVSKARKKNYGEVSADCDLGTSIVKSVKLAVYFCCISGYGSVW